MTSRKKLKILIPDDVLIPAINRTLKDFKDKGCCDKWTESERCYCRNLCGDDYLHIESDWIHLRAIQLRKAGKLNSLNKSKCRSRFDGMDSYSKEYKDYLQTEKWKEFRSVILEFWEYKCSLCMSQRNLEVHHRTYVRLGIEKINDCICLCNDCHKRHHRKLKQKEAISFLF